MIFETRGLFWDSRYFFSGVGLHTIIRSFVVRKKVLHRLRYKDETEFVNRFLFLSLLKLLKQSQFLLNFLAQERHLKPNHLECVWNAAQV